MIPRARIKEWRSLQTREGRRTSGRFLAEGVRVLEEALRFGQVPSVVLWSPSTAAERERRLVESLPGAVEVCELPPGDLERVADAKSPSGSIGVFERPRLAAPEAGPAARTLLLDGIGDPGNAGSLLRSALAFGFGRVLATDDGADPWQPKVVRATAGALFGLQVLRLPRADALELLARHQAPLIATAVDGERDRSVLVAWARRPALALAVGSEARGVHAEVLAAAELRYTIEHRPEVESLNAAIAGSLVLHELHASGREASREDRQG